MTTTPIKPLDTGEGGRTSGDSRAGISRKCGFLVMKVAEVLDPSWHNAFES